ncbi:hypothetical protein ElyMa_005427200 [Elysia marginata]|uniref:Shugoshin C-terminal domain-containing protein n=1 Tax=Elysia marginata TaxID=1093978 RepID=A0AAV4EKH9_9GAST|nr:hypothetical protein ElyMa_005427200 [Elysia marginata]
MRAWTSPRSTRAAPGSAIVRLLRVKNVLLVINNNKRKTNKRSSQREKELTLSAQCLNILQLNTCGLRNKNTELQKVLNEKQIHIAHFQETLYNNVVLNITG